MGIFFTPCWIFMKFCLRVRLKPSNDRHEFEVDWARCNKNITENSFALGHKTDSRYHIRYMYYGDLQSKHTHTNYHSHVSHFVKCTQIVVLIYTLLCEMINILCASGFVNVILSMHVC